MKTVYIFIIALALTSAFPETGQAQDSEDIVYLNNGSRIVGTVVEFVRDDYIRIRTSGGSEYVYSWDRVDRVVQDRSSDVAENAQAPGKNSSRQLEPQNIIDRSYVEVGASAGTPAGLNGIIAYWSQPVGAAVSGMWWGEAYKGLQVSAGYRIWDDMTWSHRLGAAVGGYIIQNNDWIYLGIIYNLKYKGLYVEAGPTFGIGSFSSPALGLQVGYSHRFLSN